MRRVRSASECGHSGGPRQSLNALQMCSWLSSPANSEVAVDSVRHWEACIAACQLSLEGSPKRRLPLPYALLPLISQSSPSTHFGGLRWCLQPVFSSPVCDYMSKLPPGNMWGRGGRGGGEREHLIKMTDRRKSPPMRCPGKAVSECPLRLCLQSSEVLWG